MKYNIISLSVSILSILIALKTIIESRKNFDEIKKNIQTRYLSNFPLYIPEVGDLLLKAKKEILILHVTPMHGAYSNKYGWDKINYAISEAKNKKIKIKCIFFKEEKEREAIIRQHNQGYDFEKYKLINRKKIIDFMKLGGDYEEIDINKLTLEEFVESNMRLSRIKRNDTYKDIEMKEIDSDISIIFWMIDCKEAIFAIHITDSCQVLEERIQAFFTKDSNIINSLIGLHDYHFFSNDKR